MNVNRHQVAKTLVRPLVIVKLEVSFQAGSQGSVSNWARAFADLLPDEIPKPEGKVEVAEIDELFTFIECKKTRPSS
jgi:hypothetical protein